MEGWPSSEVRTDEITSNLFPIIFLGPFSDDTQMELLIFLAWKDLEKGKGGKEEGVREMDWNGRGCVDGSGFGADGCVRWSG